MSTWLLLVVLAAAWAVVLVPDFMRRASMGRRNDAMGQFTRNLSSLGRPPATGFGRVRPVQPAYRAPLPAQRPARRPTPAAVRRRSAQAQRRQEVLGTLIAAAVLTFLGAISLGGFFVAIHVIADLALVAYLAALASLNRREVVRPVAMRSNVTPLTARRDLHRVAPAYARRPQRVAR